MKSFTTAAILSFAAIVLAVPPFDPAGAKNVGNGVGAQFIGGQCLQDKDCASTCCANPTGICSGLGAATQNGKTGCGFTTSGAAASNSTTTDPTTTDPTSTTATVAAAPEATTFGTVPANGGPSFDPAGEKNVGNGVGTQFIGGQCLDEKDCASGCCAGPSGICSGVGAQTQAGKTGCGFVSASQRFMA